MKAGRLGPGPRAPRRSASEDWAGNNSPVRRAARPLAAAWKRGIPRSGMMAAIDSMSHHPRNAGLRVS
jgi:hypothetical protein